MDTPTYWFAIRTPRDFEAERVLAPECDDIYFPKEEVRTPDGRRRLRAIIPHVLFIRTTPDRAGDLEARGRDASDPMPSLWIYRNTKDAPIQRIPDREMWLLRLLTARDDTRCNVYGRNDFERGQHVRITAGRFAGLQGYVARVKKNKHVVVKIEGICAVLLPYIHPDLLEHVHTHNCCDTL